MVPTAFNDDLEEAPDGQSLTIRSGSDRRPVARPAGDDALLPHDVADATAQIPAVGETTACVC